MNISVILCTYKRPEYALQAIESLQNQTLSEYEIILVDNAVDSNLRSSVDEFNQTARISVCYIPEAQLGLHNAQHTGVRASKGEILVFTDDDTTFDPGWLQAYSDAFESHPEMAAAGGPIRPVWEVSPPQWLLEYMGKAKMFNILSIMEPYDEFRLAPNDFHFFGANMAIRSREFFQVGGINPDSFGDIWLGNGETGLNYKLMESGMLVGYVSKALVYHHIFKERMTVRYFRERMANEGACEMYTVFHGGIPDLFNLLKHVASITIRNGKSWIKALLYRGRTDIKSLRIQMDAARTQAQVKYIIRLVLSKKHRKLVLKKDWLNEPLA